MKATVNGVFRPQYKKNYTLMMVLYTYGANPIEVLVQL